MEKNHICERNTKKVIIMGKKTLQEKLCFVQCKNNLPYQSELDTLDALLIFELFFGNLP